jgi:hypothetical protein
MKFSLYFVILVSAVIGDVVNLRVAFGTVDRPFVKGASLMERGDDKQSAARRAGVVLCYLPGADLKISREQCTNEQIRFQTIPRQNLLACTDALTEMPATFASIANERNSQISMFFSACSDQNSLPAITTDANKGWIVVMYVDKKNGDRMQRTPVGFFTMDEAEKRREVIRTAMNEMNGSNVSVEGRLNALTKATTGGGLETAVKLGTVKI